MIKSKNIKFELVTEDCAEQIVELRNNENLNKYLSHTDASIEKQKEWIRKYKKRESKGKEYYFTIKTNTDNVLGFVRLYKINKEDKTFTWGSWIMKKDKPVSSALESAVLIYEFAFNNLKMEKALFEVMKENEKVISFHKKFGAQKISEDREFEYFVLDKETYFKKREKKYARYLPLLNYKMIDFSQLGDERGHLVVIEGNKDIPFDIKRIFYIYGSDKDVVRGQHANRLSEFVLINISGRCDVFVDDGENQETVILDKPYQGIYLNKMVWKNMLNFSKDAILLVLSNEHYNREEYIRDYEEFKKIIREKK